MSISLPTRINLVSLVFTSLVASVLTVLGGFFLYQQQYDNALARAELAADDLAERASRLIALDMRLPDFLGFDKQCADVIRADPMLRDAAIFDANGTQFFHSQSDRMSWPAGAALPDADSTKTVVTDDGSLLISPIVRDKSDVEGYAVVAIDKHAVVRATLRNVAWLVVCALALFVIGLVIQQGIFWRVIGRPLARLVRTADDIRADAPTRTTLIPDVDDDDIGRLYGALSRLTQRLLDARNELVMQNERLEAAVRERTEQLEHANSELARDIERRKELEEELRTLASTDALTGLANRAFILPYLERRLEQARRNSTPLGIIMIDFDDFKIVNDTWGHAIGDEVLRIMGRRIQQVCRQSDVLARLGGDEFLISFEAYLDEAQADALCRRIVQLFDSPVQTGALSVKLGVSIGVALFPRNGDDLTNLMAAADAAMYAIKQRGGGFLFASSMSLDSQATPPV